MYKPIPGRFKDYIAMPKQNMYQSLHTTLISKTGRPFEIQIRTEEMHKTAEYGIAAHWKYKEASDGKTADQQEEAKLSWLRQILEWQRDMSDNKEFMNLIKSDLNLFSDSVYCFTPNGDVKNLPKGSTPIDFAYSIHSAVGNRMIGAKVNGKLVNIDYTLQNGDRVEVLTSQNTKGPSRDWLKIVKSSQARSKINQWFRNEFKEENIEKGKEMLTAYCKSKAVPYSEITKPEYTQRVMKKYGFHDWDAVLAAVGHGGLKEGQVINKIIEEYKVQNAKPVTDQDILNENADAQVKTKETKSKGGITVKGIHDVAVRFSKCCNPVPGDEIVGFVTRGRGVSIHRTDCVNVINMTDFDRGRLIEADWEPEDIKGGETFLTEINIYGNNRVGLLVDITKIFTEQKIDIHSINSRTSKQGIATVSLSFGVDSTESLRHLVDKIRQVESVIDVERTSGQEDIMDNLQLEIHRVGPLQTNCYFLINTDTMETLIVDPGYNATGLTKKLKNSGYRPVAILITHAHFDHIMAVKDMVSIWNIPVMILEEEIPLMEDQKTRTDIPMVDNLSLLQIDIDRYFKPGEEVELAGFKFKVIHTPGHSIGSACYYFEEDKILISGDTLFAGSIGRTDFPTGSMKMLDHSLNEVLMKLPNDVKVFPGHGPYTSIGDERISNPYVREY